MHRPREDVSHLFFGQAIAVKLDTFFATHPPLDERIRRISPRFQALAYRNERKRGLPACGWRASTGPAGAGAMPGAPEGVSGFAAAGASAGGDETRAADYSQKWGRSAKESAALVGSVDDKKVDIARRIVAAIPEPVREKLREPEGRRGDGRGTPARAERRRAEDSARGRRECRLRRPRQCRCRNPRADQGPRSGVLPAGGGPRVARVEADEQRDADEAA
jgi:hypothetical protein